MPSSSDATANDPALAIDFSARYADGLDRGLSLGGGGLFFIAWQVGYLTGLAADGVDAGLADRVVGTSAGSVVSTGLTAGRLGWMLRELTVLSRATGLIGLLARSAALSPSQQRAWDLFEAADNGRAETVSAIGHAALAARAAPSAGMRWTLGLITGVRAWPSDRLHVTAMDTYTGERCVITERTGVAPAAAMAASTSLPGYYAPAPVGDRMCMDGGVSGSALHLDLLAGTRRALVLSLPEESAAAPGLTFVPGNIGREVEALAASGTEVEMRVPESFNIDDLMDPVAVPRALAMGRRQAGADAAGLRSFWA